MTGLDYYISCFKKYAQFSGRARRSEFWYFNLFHILVLVGIFYIIITLNIPTYFIAILLFYFGFSFIPNLSVTVRRLHDTNRSGWWYFISFIPLGSFVLLIFLLQDSYEGRNRYGLDPKAPPSLKEEDLYLDHLIGDYDDEKYV